MHDGPPPLRNGASSAELFKRSTSGHPDSCPDQYTEADSDWCAVPAQS